MRIRRVRIESFGGVRNRDYRLGSGLTVLHGPNESGKTSTMAFLREVLVPSGKRDVYPARAKTDSGAVDIEDGGESVRLELSHRDVNGERPSCLDGMDYGLYSTVFAMAPKDLDADSVITKGEVKTRFLTVPGGESVPYALDSLDVLEKDEVGLRANSRSELLAVSKNIRGLEESVIQAKGEVSRYGELASEADGLEARLKELSKVAGEEAEVKRVVNLYESNRENFESLGDLKQQRAALKSFVLVGQEEVERKAALESNLENARSCENHAIEAAENIKSSLNGADPEAVSINGMAINALPGRLEVYRRDKRKLSEMADEAAARAAKDRESLGGANLSALEAEGEAIDALPSRLAAYRRDRKWLADVSEEADARRAKATASLNGSDPADVEAAGEAIDALPARLAAIRRQEGQPADNSAGDARRPSRVLLLAGVALVAVGLVLALAVTPYAIAVAAVGVILAALGVRGRGSEEPAVLEAPVSFDAEVFDSDLRALCTRFGVEFTDADSAVDGLLGVREAARALRDTPSDGLEKSLQSDVEGFESDVTTICGRVGVQCSDVESAVAELSRLRAVSRRLSEGCPSDGAGAEGSASIRNEVEGFESDLRALCSRLNVPYTSPDDTVSRLSVLLNVSSKAFAADNSVLESRAARLEAEAKLNEFLAPFGGADGFELSRTSSESAASIDLKISALEDSLRAAGLDPSSPVCPVSAPETGVEEEIGKINRRLGELRSSMSSILDMESLEADIDRLSQLKARRDELLVSGAVTILAKHILEDACRVAYDEVQPGVVTSANRYFHSMVGGGFSIEVDPKTSDISISSDDCRRPMAKWSSGLRAQVLLSLKLAIAREMGNGEIPVILDDVLLPFDSRRKAGAIHALAEASSEMQVILFTCDAETCALAEAEPQVEVLSML